jgi:hypothetical protein
VLHHSYLQYKEDNTIVFSFYRGIWLSPIFLLSFKFQNHVSPLGKSLPSIKLFQVKDALLGQVADKIILI